MNGVKKLAVALAVVSLSAFARADAVSSAQGILDAILAASATEPSVIEVATGTYSFKAIIAISKPITLKSVSGNPADVTFSLSSGDRLLDVAHAQAVVEGITLKGGSGQSASGGIAGRNTYVSAGTVRNCVVTGAKLTTPSNSGTCAVSVLLNGADALMTGCVISNNTMSGTSTGGSPGIMCAGVAVNGGATLEKSLVIDNHMMDYTKTARDAAGVTVLKGVMSQCAVVFNDGPYVGGVNAGANGLVENCVVFGNRSDRKNGTYDDIVPGTEARFVDCLVSPSQPNMCFADFIKRDFRAAPGLPTSTIGLAAFGDEETVVGFVTPYAAVIAPSNVTFTAACQNVGEGVTYKWDFGDGSAEVVTAETTVAHRYETAGLRTVKLVVMNGEVKIGEATRLIRLDNPVVAVNSMDDLKEAVASVADGCEIRVAKGEYALSTPIVLNRKLRIVGETGNPEDVIITPASDVRPFRLGHPEAELAGLTVSGGTYPNALGLGIILSVDPHGGTVSNCVFRNCGQTVGATANYDIVPFYVGGQNSLMTHCVVSNTTSKANGGTGLWGVITTGVYLSDGAKLVNSLIAGNDDNGVRTSASKVKNSYAAGICVNGGSVLNCTVVNNHSEQQVGGVRVISGSVANTVIAGNTCGADTTSNNIYPGQGGSFNHCAADSWPDEEKPVIDTVAALFNDWDNGDYTTTAGSPLVNAGLSDSVDLPAKDLLGQKRVIGGEVDIGAYEFDSEKFSANFSCAKTSYLLPGGITFTASCSGVSPGDNVKYYWDFDGDGVTDLETSEAEVTREFTTEYGVHSIALTVTNFTTGANGPCRRNNYLTLLPRTMYVDPASQNPVSPYDTVEKAAVNIQDAVDAAIDGVTILLQPNDYRLTGEILVEKQVTIRGATGKPEDVRITPKAEKRAFYLNKGAAVENVVVENGTTTTQAGGLVSGIGFYVDVLGGAVSNCVVRNCSITGSGMSGSTSSTVYLKGALSLMTHCVVTNNAIDHDSTSTSSSASVPGVLLAEGARLENSLVADNVDNGTRTVTSYACGVYASSGSIVNCTIVNNRGQDAGGVGLTSATVKNCAIAGNSSTKSSNANIIAGTEARFSFCCSDDAEAWNATCFAATPAGMFSDYDNKVYTPAPGGSLQDKGTIEGLSLPTVDLAGNPRVSGDGIDIGAYEIDASAKILTFATETTALLVPVEVTFAATAIGYGDLEELTFKWDFGDGSPIEVVPGSAVVTHRYDHAGDVSVTLTLVQTQTGAELDAECRPGYLHLVPQIMRVAKSAPASAFPYDTAENAATNIQDAINASIGGGVISIAPGVYRNAEQVAVEKGVTIRGETGRPDDVVLVKSVNNGSVVYMNDSGSRLENLTVVGGSRPSAVQGAAICVDLKGGTVSNCTVRGVSLSGNIGYHVWADSVCLRNPNAFMTHCVVTGNVSSLNSTSGEPGPLTLGVSLTGGARLENSLIADNVDTGVRSVYMNYPAGVYASSGKVVNCTIVGNTSVDGGGLRVNEGASAVNCVVAGNTGGKFDNVPEGTTDRCMAYQIGGELNELFRRPARGDWRAKPDGALFETGTLEGIVPPAVDLLGNPRLRKGKIDIGACAAKVAGFQILVR